MASFHVLHRLELLGSGHVSLDFVDLHIYKLLSGAEMNWLPLLLTPSILSFCVTVLKLSAMVGSLMD